MLKWLFSFLRPLRREADPWAGIERTHLVVVRERLEDLEKRLSVRARFNPDKNCVDFRNAKDEALFRVSVPFGGRQDAPVRVMHVDTLPDSWKETIKDLLENQIHFVPFPTLTS